MAVACGRQPDERVDVMRTAKHVRTRMDMESDNMETNQTEAPSAGEPARPSAAPDPVRTRREAWLNRNVVGMGLTSVLSDAGHEAATSVLPGFLSALGAPPVALDVIEGVADAPSSFVKLGAGWISDRVGWRKPIVVAGYAVVGIATALFALAGSWSGSDAACAALFVKRCWPNRSPPTREERRLGFTGLVTLWVQLQGRCWRLRCLPCFGPWSLSIRPALTAISSCLRSCQASALHWPLPLWSESRGARHRTGSGSG